MKELTVYMQGECAEECAQESLSSLLGSQYIIAQWKIK